MKWWGGFAVIIYVLAGASTTHATTIIDHVVINEIMANPQTGEVEWIELFNPTDAEVSMSGWRISATSGNFSGVFDTDTVIPAKGYVVRKASDTVSKLNNTAATLTLKVATNGPTIDQVSYAEIVRGMSYARTCDAEETWRSQVVPTEGLPNCNESEPVDDTAPTIGTITGGSLKGTVSIPVTATDNSTVTLLITARQYGTNVASLVSSGDATFVFDTSVLPNGPLQLLITATDEVGNMSNVTVEYTIHNPPATPVKPTEPENVSQPVIVAPASPDNPVVNEPEEVIIVPDVPIVAIPNAVRPLTITATMQVVAVTSAVPTVVASASPVISTSSPQITRPTLISEESIIETGNGTNRALNESVVATTKPPVTAVAGAVPSSFVGIGAILAIGMALWRYLRRTKP